jgi:hypothetical protein
MAASASYRLGHCTKKRELKRELKEGIKEGIKRELR